MSKANPLASVTCKFCGYKGHTLAQCRKFKAAKVEARKPKQARVTNATSNTTLTQPTITENAAIVTAPNATEFAGNASCCLSQPTMPLTNTHLWIADMGATSHMTPHCYWLRDYKPLHVLIRLADDTVVYSQGVGSAVFKPVISGRSMRPVEFTRVLHIPELQNNLLAILYLS